MPFALPEISIGLALLLLLFFVLGFIFYSSLYAAVGASVNTEQEAQQAVQPMLILLVATAIFINPDRQKIMNMVPYVRWGEGLMIPKASTLASTPSLIRTAITSSPGRPPRVAR